MQFLRQFFVPQSTTAIESSCKLSEVSTKASQTHYCTRSINLKYSRFPLYSYSHVQHHIVSITPPGHLTFHLCLNAHPNRKRYQIRALRLNGRSPISIQLYGKINGANTTRNSNAFQDVKFCPFGIPNKMDTNTKKQRPWEWKNRQINDKITNENEGGVKI